MKRSILLLSTIVVFTCLGSPPPKAGLFLVELTPIGEAIEKGNVERVKTLILSEGVSPNALATKVKTPGREDVSKTALELAVREQQVEIVKVLLVAGADDPEGKCLKIATEENMQEIVELLELARAGKRNKANAEFAEKIKQEWQPHPVQINRR